MQLTQCTYFAIFQIYRTGIYIIIFVCMNSQLFRFKNGELPIRPNIWIIAKNSPNKRYQYLINQHKRQYGISSLYRTGISCNQDCRPGLSSIRIPLAQSGSLIRTQAKLKLYRSNKFKIFLEVPVVFSTGTGLSYQCRYRYFPV
jgi:hypothetical protein